MSQTVNEPTQTVADSLRNDPRIAEAKRLVREAIGEHAGRLQVRPASEELKGSFASLIERLTAVRDGPPIWPYLSSGLGSGPYVELADGSVKLTINVGGAA